MGVVLAEHQLEAVKKLKSGSILCGGVGTGKTRTALAYYYFKACGGKQPINGSGAWKVMTNPMKLFVITTAKKRDSNDWANEARDFGIFESGFMDEMDEVFEYSSDDEKMSDIYAQSHETPIVVDSWNNIKKYTDVEGAFFIFDEQRLVGSGAWVKAFLSISKKNQWILLSATPGDTWMDYIPVFVANGFYKNRTEFIRKHVVYNRFAKFPKVDKYINVRELLVNRSRILVNMYYPRDTVRHIIDIPVKYDKKKYKTVFKDRWNIFEDEPIKNISELCYTARKVINSDVNRSESLRNLLLKNKRAIVFYNYNYELEIIRDVCESVGKTYSEWNGHNHEEIPDSEEWVYIVQYTAGSEGWNCIKTNTVIFFSLNYSYKIMEQSSGRIDRMNTKYKDLYYYRLISKAPLDVGVLAALMKKKKFNESRFVKGEIGE